MVEHVDGVEPEAGRMYTAAEVAAYFKVNVKTVYTWVNRGKLPAVYTPSGGIRVTSEVMQALLNGELEAQH